MRIYNRDGSLMGEFIFFCIFASIDIVLLSAVIYWSII